MTTVGIAQGQIAGTNAHGVEHFLGLPYAAPPMDEGRWMPPQPAPAWDGVRDGSVPPTRALQTPYAGILGGRDLPGEESEDCLYLNIYTPAADDAKRPVMFWIHGGAYIQGSANEYDGSALARDNDVVVVTINYRLGIFGFLDLSRFGERYQGSASLGFQDQIAALGWVRDNIAAFGGDPDNVTIFGESAGGGSVLALLAAPSAAGLFHKAIACSPGDTIGPPVDLAPAFAAHFEIDADDVLEKLMSLSGVDLRQLQIDGVYQGGAAIDGVVMTQPTREAIRANGENGVPLIAGCCKDEGTLFEDVVPAETAPMLAAMLSVSVGLGDTTRYNAYLDAHYPMDDPKARTERVWYDLFRSATLRNAEASAMAGAGGWVYNFDVPTDNPLGVTHASDIAFTFNLFDGLDAGLAFHEMSDENADIARRWSRTLAAFARTGDPNGAGLPTWRQYTPEGRECLVLDRDPRVEADLDGDELRGAYQM